MAFEDQRDKVASYVDLGRTEGARVLTGGRPTDGGLGGYFYEPTVLVDVDNDMRVVREEIFGPVAAIMPFDSEEEVVRLANDTEYGLAAGVWTSNLSGHTAWLSARSRHHLGEHLPGDVADVAAPGLQEQRRRHRARHRDHQGVHPAQECLDQHQREPVADPFVLRS